MIVTSAIIISDRRELIFSGYICQTFIINVYEIKFSKYLNKLARANACIYVVRYNKRHSPSSPPPPASPRINLSRHFGDENRFRCFCYSGELISRVIHNATDAAAELKAHFLRNGRVDDL